MHEVQKIPDCIAQGRAKRKTNGAENATRQRYESDLQDESSLTLRVGEKKPTSQRYERRSDNPT
jgi:hypothetical protein